MLSRKLATLMATIFLTLNSLIIGAAATATDALFYYNAIDADPGLYEPVALAGDIEVSACNSTFQDYSLCQLSDVSDFTIRWLGWDQVDGEWAYLSTFSGATAANGLNTSFSTGAGTFFDNVGSYFIGLYVQLAGNSTVVLPNSTSITSGIHGAANFQWGDSFAMTEAVTVPEPYAFLTLLPALWVMTRRERKRQLQLS